ncbi:MAG TPA: glycerol-3-phosphate 1-O-acyltransferase PlsY [Candidatus Limnocylindrales bacterium]|nr:glycerol-3-phosphate 1-O-acyltransferase PlsY [Candidatus Limnocylindrales bacterium]
MTHSGQMWLFVTVGYFLGSIPFGLILAKTFGGKDVREHGSGNIGATNVSRVAGPLAGILTLVLDIAKGAAAVWLASRFTQLSATAMMLAGLAALVGHCFPVWLGFRGGKGVATGLGVFAALCPLAAIAGVCVFVLAFVCWRYVSLASLAGTAAMPLSIYFLWAPRHAPPLTVTLGTLAAAALIFFKHRANLQRLREGVEPKYPLGHPKGRDA